MFASTLSIRAEEDKAESVELPPEKPEKPADKPADKTPEKVDKVPSPTKRDKKKKEPPPTIEVESKTEKDVKPAPPEPKNEPKPAPKVDPKDEPQPNPPTPKPTDPVVPKPVDPPPVKPESTEPGAETILLPAERPKTQPKSTATDPKSKPPAVEELDTPELAIETPNVKPGESAVFSLYGPELYLRGATAQYVLRDEFKREVLRGEVKVRELPYSEGKPRQLKVPVINPLSQHHRLELTLTGPDGKAAVLRESFDVPLVRSWENWISLVASPPMMGAGPSNDGETGWSALRSLGISGGMQYRLHPARREALRRGGAAFYVENIARQLLSRYHTERGVWDKTIAEMIKDSGNHTALSRDPSLCSPAFAETFAKELKRHADVYVKDPPLFYSLASEPSITRLAAAADFDFTPAALQEFQRWLERDVYGTVKALNTSWGTNFAKWEDVMPMTTDEARLRLSDGVMNFGPWVDFRDFQDFIFAKTLHDGAEFIRRTDPNAKVGVTGAMGPFANGGWDWSRLARSIDVVECYDIGCARSLWRDLAPGKPAIAIVPLFESDASRSTDDAAADASRAIWSLALEGGPRGVVLWDDAPGAQDGKPAQRALLDSDGKSSDLARSLAPTLQALNGDTGALLAQSQRISDVAVLYSPASVRLHWFLEADKLHPKDWLATWGADTSAERRESPQLRLRESWSKLLDDIGLSWRFISSAQVEAKDILRPESGIKTLVLPQAICLSDREADIIHQFVAAGGKIVADASCGRFDEHGKVREKPALDDLFGVDTSREPYFAEPMNPLETISIQGSGTGALSKENISNLAPVFSDRPARVSASGLDYRRSPVLGATKSSVYLNLDLGDYLRWRLHPDQPRAKAVREVVAAVAFADRLNESPIDWQRSQIPLGTQVVVYSPGSQKAAPGNPLVLALRRNPQSRLHELGSEAEGNWAFEKVEPFTIVLRSAATVLSLPTGVQSGGVVQKIEGKLNPVTPAIFVLNPKPAVAPKLTLPAAVQAGTSLNLAATGTGSALFSVHVTAPDGSDRPWLSVTKNAADGVLAHTIPFALSDPPGVWKITVRDLIKGTETSGSVELKAP